MGVFEQALSNHSVLRAQNGGGVSRLSFAADSLALQETNIRAAVGRITEDADIAKESANLAKYSILTQAAAAMVAQANTTNDAGAFCFYGKNQRRKLLTPHSKQHGYPPTQTQVGGRKDKEVFPLNNYIRR